MDADDLCVYEPLGQASVYPLEYSVKSAPNWSTNAEQRLSRVPGFLRLMVKKRAEAYVRELGEDRVTSQHLSDMAIARFGSAGPPKSFKERPASKSKSEKA